ncbi:MAG: hypothetical protein JW797_17835 [Bradymonadales bacterium]|nr:hypothetical protein [Bradymonadales bacterium]
MMKKAVPVMLAVGALLVCCSIQAQEYEYTPEEWYEMTGQDPYAAEDGSTDAQEPSAIPYVFGLDEEGSDEQLREEGQSGFDEPGAMAIDLVNSGVFVDVDGEYTIEIPAVPPPTPVEEE